MSDRLFEDRLFDTQRVRRNFSRAADSYAQAAVLQREVEQRCLEQLFALTEIQPQRVLDLGCGTGRSSGLIKKHWRRSEVIALDIALPMLQQVPKHTRFWRPVRRVCANVSRLPFAEQTIDVVFSNLCLQWVSDLPGVLNEIRRVIKPAGVLLISTFGPETLSELRDAYLQNQYPPPLSDFAAIAQVGDALMQSGFKNPVLLRENFTLTYPSVRDIAKDLRAIGATDARHQRSRGLHGRAYWQKIESSYDAMRNSDGKLPSTWEVITAQAFAPEEGAPIRDSGHDIARFDAHSIPIRRRE
jgi:malonyl-CoA O-methyltransferase